MANWSAVASIFPCIAYSMAVGSAHDLDTVPLRASAQGLCDGRRGQRGPIKIAELADTIYTALLISLHASCSTQEIHNLLK